jgi:hypothetical protein
VNFVKASKYLDGARTANILRVAHIDLLEVAHANGPQKKVSKQKQKKIEQRNPDPYLHKFYQRIARSTSRKNFSKSLITSISSNIVM